MASRLRLIWALALAGMLAGAAVAEGRLLDDAEAARFHGVGRLNIYGSRFCTATLITPRLVLTAAHCLYSPISGHLVKLGGLEFVAGQRGEARVAVRGVARMATMPGFAFSPKADLGEIALDLALLELDRPVPRGKAMPFAVRPTRAGAALTIVSYAFDRPLTPRIEEPCPVRIQSRVVVLGCAVKSGASGAPVLSQTDGELRLVGVVSAMGASFGGGVALTVMAAPRMAELRAELAKQKPRRAKPERAGGDLKRRNPDPTSVIPEPLSGPAD